MKKNFLSELKIDNSFYVYGDYEFKEELFFLKNELKAIFYEGFSPTKILPLPKDLLIKELFIKGKLYGESADGQIRRIETEDKLNCYKNKAAYLIAKKALTTFTQENYLNQLFPNAQVTTEYNLNTFGRTLYTELDKWDFSSFSEIITFCKTWGLPTGVTISALEKKVAVNDVNIIWMSLDDFFIKVHEYQKVFSYFKALHTNDFSSLPTSPKKGERKKEHAQRLLASEIEERSLFSFKLIEQKGNQIPISVFRDLFEAAYFYLKLSINSSAEMRTCENCGHLFEVTHQRQRFCSVLPGRRRSSCEMAFNNRLKKKKKLKGDV